MKETKQKRHILYRSMKDKYFRLIILKCINIHLSKCQEVKVQGTMGADPRDYQKGHGTFQKQENRLGAQTRR